LLQLRVTSARRRSTLASSRSRLRISITVPSKLASSARSSLIRAAAIFFSTVRCTSGSSGHAGVRFDVRPPAASLVVCGAALRRARVLAGFGGGPMPAMSSSSGEWTPSC
jgi:hypothetical protein